MRAGCDALPERLSSVGDRSDSAAEDGGEEEGAPDVVGQGVADGLAVFGVAGDAGDAGVRGEAAGEDTHGSGDLGDSRRGASDAGCEDSVEGSTEGSEDAVEGVDELTDGEGRTAGGAVFWSCLPVSPWWRWNQARWSGS